MRICSSERDYAAAGRPVPSGRNLGVLRRSGVLAEHAEDFALDADVLGGGVNRFHLTVRGLEADEGAFAVEALEGGVGAIDQGNDDLAFAGGTGALDQDVVTGDDVFVAHGVALDFEGVDLAAANYVAQRDCFGGFDGFDGLTGGDAAEEWKAVHDFARGALGDDVDGAAAVVRALEEAFGLEIGDVLMDGGEGAEAEAGSDLLVGG